MITLQNVTEKAFPKVYEKMEAAFPYEERRDFSDERECLSNNDFKLFEILWNGEAVGFIAIWDFPQFLFIEHLAIDEDKRSGGYGSEAIELLKESFKKPMILEAEAPETEQQIKRIRFYSRLGFKMNPFDYAQPSYHGAESVPLKILSYPAHLSEEEFADFLTLTRKIVYKL